MSRSFEVKKPETASAADWSDIADLQKRITEAAEELASMTTDVGNARHIVEYDSDRRKRALARAMMGPLKAGESASASEAEGRASEGYRKELTQLGLEFKAASEVITKWDAAKIKWETCRSLLSMCRTQVGL